MEELDLRLAFLDIGNCGWPERVLRFDRGELLFCDFLGHARLREVGLAVERPGSVGFGDFFNVGVDLGEVVASDVGVGEEGASGEGEVESDGGDEEESDGLGSERESVPGLGAAAFFGLVDECGGSGSVAEVFGEFVG